MEKLTLTIQMCILFSGINLISCTPNFVQKMNYSIKITQVDYSLGGNLTFTLTNDSLRIVNYYQEESKIIFTSQINSKLRSDIINWFSSFDPNKLENEYNNPTVKDGDQIYFTINTDDANKEIKVSNYYVPKLGQLVDLLNDFLNDSSESKINYKKRP